MNATHPTGRSGPQFLAYQLSRMGWGSAENPTEDVGNGIDMFIFVRRPLTGGGTRFVEIGVIAAQVKTGPSWFAEPADGGWWFRLSGQERTDWLQRPMAHIVVLVDTANEVAYWAELTPASTIEAGNSFKVFVPASQTVGPTSEDDLRDVLIRSLVRLGSYRGSSWIEPGTASMERDDELCAALLTPRLVAPHANRMTAAPITGTQAIALVCAGRIADLERNLEVFARDGSVPAFGAMESATWQWRFAKALYDIDHSADVLLACADSAESPAERAAALVASACAIARTGDTQRAHDILASNLEGFSGFLMGWLTVLQARFARLNGDNEHAAALLDGALPKVTIDQRPWPTAILMSLRTAQLNLNLVDAELLEQAIEASDSPPAWWNAQARAAALDAHLDSLFTQFAPMGSIRFVAEDIANNRLVGLMLSADLAGDQGRYVHESKLSARRLAIERPTDGPSIAEAIEILRQAGDTQAVSHLASRMLHIGAFEDLRSLWRDPADPNWWRPPSRQATARLARALLTVIPEAEVDRLAVLLLASLRGEVQPLGIDSGTAMDLASNAVGLCSAALSVARQWHGTTLRCVPPV